MTTFDRHIVRRFVSTILFLLGTLIIFFIVLHYVEHADDFHDRGATMEMIFLAYYPSYIPEIIKLTSPLAVFLACIYTAGRLTQEMQLFALQTSGVSLYRFIMPFLLVGATMTAGMFWFNGWVVPEANKQRIEFETQYVRTGGGHAESNNIHRQNRPGTILVVGYFDRETKTAHRVSLQSFDEDRRLERRVDSRSMVWVDSTQSWVMQDAIIRSFAADGSADIFKKTLMDTVLQVYPRDLARTERDAEVLSIPAAADYVDALKRSGANNIGRPLVDYYAKFAYPFANLILVFVGIPLAAVRRKGGQTIRLTIGLLIAFLYLALIKLTEPFGYQGALDPALTAWLPHIVFLVVGLTLLVRAKK